MLKYPSFPVFRLPQGFRVPRISPHRAVSVWWRHLFERRSVGFRCLALTVTDPAEILTVLTDVAMDVLLQQKSFK